MPLRLAPAAAQQIARKAGVSIPDPVPRTTRTAHPEWVSGLRTQLRALGLPQGQPEFRFHPTRKWRYDLALVEARLLVEVDGGAWLHRQGKTAHSHGQGRGFERDRVKDAEALLLGYRVLRLTPRMVKDGRGVAYLAHLLGKPLRNTGI